MFSYPLQIPLILDRYTLKMVFKSLITITVYWTIWRKCSRQTLFLGEIMDMCVWCICCRYIRMDGYTKPFSLTLWLSLSLSVSILYVSLFLNRQDTYGENATSLFLIDDCCLCCTWVHFLIMRCAATQVYRQCLDVQPDAKTMHWMCKLMHAGWTFCNP